MALTPQERAYAQGEIRRLQASIADKEAILDGYKRDPTKHHLIKDMENRLSGLRRQLKDVQDALRRG
jgi:hypothetical protein